MAVHRGKLPHTRPVHKVELSYSLAGEPHAARRIRNPLIELLQAVREQGSISGAAKVLGLSYRHVWGELKRWEAELGQALIVWERGQPARLSAFGEKLLWAERQAQARLAPQIEALHADLERAFAVAFDARAQVLTLYASHDEGLSRLREHAVRAAQLHLDIRFCGSVDAISALNEGRCSVAGFHVRERAVPGGLAQRTYQPLLEPGVHKLIGFARRTQGWMLAPGNPTGFTSVRDLQRSGVRLANRALGAGTRLLLDEMLQEEAIAPESIAGYASTESSHAAVAQAVAAGAADVGLGIEAAAREHRLDFVPAVHEHYYLVCLKDVLDLPPTLALRRELQSPQWHAIVAALAGYEPWRSGEVLSLREQLPWWDLPPKRRRRGSA
jgi:putative molybdopterin biosynthesis protein